MEHFLQGKVPLKHLINAWWRSTFNEVNDWAPEMKTFKREYLNNWYSIVSYYFAKSMADLPFQIILPSAFVTYIFFMTSQPLEGGEFRVVKWVQSSTEGHVFVLFSFEITCKLWNPRAHLASPAMQEICKRNNI